MRLDHLLSREEEVGVGLLFNCQGSENPRQKEPGRVRMPEGDLPETIFPVAMRLGDTPVPIPNTMVKT